MSSCWFLLIWWTTTWTILAFSPHLSANSLSNTESLPPPSAVLSLNCWMPLSMDSSVRTFNLHFWERTLSMGAQGLCTIYFVFNPAGYTHVQSYLHGPFSPAPRWFHTFTMQLPCLSHSVFHPGISNLINNFWKKFVYGACFDSTYAKKLWTLGSLFVLYHSMVLTDAQCYVLTIAASYRMLSPS